LIQSPGPEPEASIFRPNFPTPSRHLRPTLSRTSDKMADVPLYVISEFSSSERRITPSWSIAQLKKKLEPITGIPPSCQVISLRIPPGDSIPVEAADEESVYMQSFNLVPYAELHVSPIPASFSFSFLERPSQPKRRSCKTMSCLTQVGGVARGGLFTSALGVKDHGNCSGLARKSKEIWALVSCNIGVYHVAHFYPSGERVWTTGAGRPITQSPLIALDFRPHSLHTAF